MRTRTQSTRRSSIVCVHEWCTTLKTVYNGRFPNEVRAGYLKVLLSVGLKCTARRGPYTAAATARVLGVKAKHLIIERLYYYYYYYYYY